MGVFSGVFPILEGKQDAGRAFADAQAAITALGALGGRSAIPALVPAIETEETRYEAFLALGAMPDLRALPVRPAA